VCVCVAIWVVLFSRRLSAYARARRLAARLSTGPLGLVLLAAEALVVVALLAEELHQMGLAVVDAAERCEVSQFELAFAVAALEAAFVEGLAVDVDLLHGIDVLGAHWALFGRHDCSCCGFSRSNI